MRRFINIVINSHIAWILASMNILVYLLQVHDVFTFTDLFTLSNDFERAILQPWRLVSFAFIHLSPLHLAFNTILIILAGAWLQHLASSAEVVATYLLGALCGAFSFIAICTYAGPSTFVLTGASSAVIAMLIVALVHTDNISLTIGRRQIVLRPRYLIIIIVLIIVSGFIGYNFGGTAAHVGGIIGGLIIPVLTKAFSRRPADSLIEKVNVSGFSSLSTEERKRLFNMNPNNK